MQRAADRGRKDLSLIPLKSINMGKLGDQFHSVPIAVINTSNKGRNIISACLCGQDRLSRREYQRAIGAYTIIGEIFKGFYTILYHRHLYHDIGVNGSEPFTLFHNAVKIS